MSEPQTRNCRAKFEIWPAAFAKNCFGMEGKTGILEIGLEKGRQEGNRETLVRNVESVMKNFNITLQKACDGPGITTKEYEEAKAQIALLHKG